MPGDQLRSESNYRTEQFDRIAEQVSGQVVRWDRSVGKGIIEDEAGTEHRVVAKNVDSPVIEQGNPVKFDIVDEQGIDRTRAERVIVLTDGEADKTESSDTDEGVELPPMDGTGVLAGITSLAFATILFAALSLTLTSFPVRPFSLVTYAQSFTYSVWGVLIVSCSTAVGVSTTYWYWYRTDAATRAQISSVPGFIFGSFTFTAVAIAAIGLFRWLVLIISALLFLVLLLFAVPSELLNGLRGDARGVGRALLMMSCLYAMYTIFALPIGLANQSVLFAVAAIPPVVGGLPHLSGRPTLNDAEEQQALLAEKQSQIEEAIADIDQPLLRSYGIDFPHQKVILRQKTAQAGDTLILPDDSNILDGHKAYYEQLAVFSGTLQKIAEQTEEPTVVTQQLCKAVNLPHKTDSSLAEAATTLTQLTELLNSYQTLLQHNDHAAISVFSDQLPALLVNVQQDSDTPPEDSVPAIEEVQRWVNTRARKDELAQQWEETVKSVFRVEFSDYTISVAFPDNTGATDRQSELEVVEGLIQVAQRIEDSHALKKSPLKEDFVKNIGQYLGGRSREQVDIAMLQSAIDGFEEALSAAQEYPSFPFETAVEQLVTAVGTARDAESTVADTVRAITDSHRVLSFLENVDSSHPTIPQGEWHEAVRIALENGSSDSIRSPAKRVDRMSETLWELHHLYQFDWQEFEHLIANLYARQGYETTVTTGSRDMGVDVWAENATERLAIQVKQFAKENTVGREVIQKLESTLARGDADRIVVVTSSSFADTSHRYASDSNNVKLIDGRELIEKLTKYGVPTPERPQ